MPKNKPVAHGFITEICERLGYDPATVHKIEITPGSVKVTHNHLVENPNGGYVGNTEMVTDLQPLIDTVEEIKQAVRDSVRAGGGSVQTMKGAHR